MHNLTDEICEAVKSSRIANVKDSIGDIVSMLTQDLSLQEDVEKRLDKEDILWFNKNNSEIFFVIPEDQNYYSNKKLDLTEEINWFTKEISSPEHINWDNIKYRYKQALKLLGTQDGTYYNNIREVVSLNHQDRWRYLNE